MLNPFVCLTYCPWPADTRPCAGHCWLRPWTPPSGSGQWCRGCDPPAKPSGGSTQLWSDRCEGLQNENNQVSVEGKEGQREREEVMDEGEGGEKMFKTIEDGEKKKGMRWGGERKEGGKI